jgi:ribosomal protein S18 acetylase RimI-like enzyme
MLFVDGANDAAFRLYTSLGFGTVRLDRAYERTVHAA